MLALLFKIFVLRVMGVYKSSFEAVLYIVVNQSA